VKSLTKKCYHAISQSLDCSKRACHAINNKEIYVRSFPEFIIAKNAKARVSRAFIATGALLSLFGFLFMNFDPLREWSSISGTRTGLLLIAVGISVLTLVYLQSGERNNGVNEREFMTVMTEVMQRHNELEKQYSEVQASVQANGAGIGLTQEERELALQGLIASVGDDVLQKVFDEKSSTLLADLKKAAQSEIRMTARSTVERLRREINDLRLRSNVNLIIGMGITAGGLYLLWTTVALVDASTLLKALASEGSDSNAKFVKNLVLPVVPRLMLVIFVEVFAYFFLRLYRTGLSEMKYFQNELTNIESKLIAVEYAVATDHVDSLKVSLEALAKTERNFILEKNQTTVELERAKSESELTRNVIKTIPELFKKSGSK
jgi:hypothetical protein